MKDWTDEERKDFLVHLDRSVRVNLNDWEMEFVGGNRSKDSFSPKQREIIDKLIKDYRDDIGW